VRHVEPEDERRQPGLGRPQPRTLRDERATRLPELERAHVPLAVVRVHSRRGSRIASGKQGVRRRGATPGVQPLPACARVRWNVGRKGDVRQGGLEPEPRAADDDRRAPGRDDLVDGLVREALELADGALPVERPDPDEARARVLVRQDRQPAVDLHRVRGDELGGDPGRDRLRDGGLPRRGRSENAEDARGRA